jgi:hypothetical protein
MLFYRHPCNRHISPELRNLAFKIPPLLSS